MKRKSSYFDTQSITEHFNTGGVHMSLPACTSLQHAHTFVSPPPPDWWALQTQLPSAGKMLEHHSNQKQSHKQAWMWPSSTTNEDEEKARGRVAQQGL